MGNKSFYRHLIQLGYDRVSDKSNRNDESESNRVTSINFTPFPLRFRQSKAPIIDRASKFYVRRKPRSTHRSI